MDDFDTLIGRCGPRLAARGPALRVALDGVVAEAEAVAARRGPRLRVVVAGVVALAAAGGGAAATARVTEQVVVAPIRSSPALPAGVAFERVTCGAADDPDAPAVLVRIDQADPRSRAAELSITWPAACGTPHRCLLASDPRRAPVGTIPCLPEKAGQP